MSKSKEGTIVTVTSKGQATIPKEFRDKLHIDVPGRVRFVETEAGEVVVRPVERPSELRGALVSGADSETETTDMLRSERERDTDDLDELLDADE